MAIFTFALLESNIKVGRISIFIVSAGGVRVATAGV